MVLRWILNKRWQFALVLMALVVAVGVVGYMLLADLHFVEALYQTVITLTTTGFSDLADEKSLHAPAVRLFTISLLIFGAGVVAFAVSVFLRALYEGELRESIGLHRNRRRVRFMKNHYIICGYGRMGEIIARAMQQQKIPLVVVDLDPLKRVLIAERDIICVVGDATHDEVLREAAVEKARGLICVTDSDPENLFITMTARQLNPRLQIVSRALSEQTEEKLRRAGANRVILPYKLGAHQLAQAALRPNVIDFIEIATRTSSLDIEIEEMRVEADSELAGKPLREAVVLRELGLIVIGIRSGRDQAMHFNPSAATCIEAGDTLIALGKPGALQEIRRHLG